jgi:hypothetical protein
MTLLFSQGLLSILNEAYASTSAPPKKGWSHFQHVLRLAVQSRSWVLVRSFGGCPFRRPWVPKLGTCATLAKVD